MLKASAILILSISLAGCSGEKPEVKSESASALIPTLEAVENSALKSDTIEDIPDIEGFAELLQVVAAKMGIEPIETLTYIDCNEVDGGTSCNFTFPYGDSEAYAYFGYDGEKWLAAWVLDAKRLEVYWVADGMEEYLPPTYKKTETKDVESSSLADIEKIKQEAEKPHQIPRKLQMGICTMQ